MDSQPQPLSAYATSPCVHSHQLLHALPTGGFSRSNFCWQTNQLWQ